jgi:glutathione S-transferase
MPVPYTLHGLWLSGPTYKVALMLSLTGQRFHFEHIDLRGGAHQSADYRAKSRWGQVPCLSVAATGRNLVQSAAILGYLAQATGKFAGHGPDEQQDIREWIMWNADRLTAPIYRSRAARAGFRSFDPATAEMYATEGKAALAMLDAALAERNWLVGTSPTIADIDVYGVVFYAPDGGFDLASYPNIGRWMTRMEALPGWGRPDAIMPKESRHLPPQNATKA